MQNNQLAKDYISRCKKRLKALDTLFEEEAWADVVRESQEVVELGLKALLRHFQIEVPRIHDVSGILVAEKKRFTPEINKNLARFVSISRELRRDRELAFYGSEDLTPEEFYKKEDAEKARASAQFVIKNLEKHIK